MSGNPEAEPVKTAVPVADLSVIDHALAEGGAALKDAVKKVRPADLGRDLSRRPLDECRAILDACDERRAIAMMVAAHPGVSGRMLAGVDPTRAAHLLGHMPFDHQSAILGQLEEDDRKKIEGAIEGDRRKVLDRLLAYPESAVGRLMTPKIWRAEITSTVGDAIRRLKDDESIEVAVNCYIVEHELLVGVAALRELAVLPDETPLADVMVKTPIAVNEKTERGDAAEIIKTHDFLSLPVIDADGKLVGAVRVDDLLDGLLDKVGVGILNQGAVAGSVIGNIPYFQTSLPKVVRSRITWLVLLFVTETATGTVLRYFDDEIAKVVALSFFVPLLIGTGGNSGSQTVSTVIRALALGEARLKDWWRVMMKESLTGLSVGLMLGVIGFCRSLLWGVGYEIAFCVAITLIVICTWANTVGALIPLAAQRFKIDPTVVSAPAIATLVDATGLFIYFSIAAVTVSKLHEEAKEKVIWHADVAGHVVRWQNGDDTLAAWAEDGKPGSVVYDVTGPDGQRHLGHADLAAGALKVGDHDAVLHAQTPDGPIDVTWTSNPQIPTHGDGAQRHGAIQLDGADDGFAATLSGNVLGVATDGTGDIGDAGDGLEAKLIR